MVSFVHTGDIHLGLQFNNVSFDREKAMTRRRELWSTFESIAKYTGENKINFLLIAGDLFEDRYFTLGDIKRVRDILSTIGDTNVLIIAGNHDYLYEKSLYNKVEWSSNVHIFKGNGLEKKEFPDLNTVIYGYSWDKIEIRDNRIFNNFNVPHGDSNQILLLHGDIGSNSKYLPLDLDLLRGLNMDYIALGHIHKPEIIDDKIAYCGCPEPLDFGEIGQRGFIQGEIIQGSTNVEFIPFSKRNFWNMEIVVDSDMGYLDIVDLFKNIQYGKRDRDLYRIDLKGYIQDDLDIDSLIKSIEDDFYHIEIADNTTLDYDLDSLEYTYGDSIIGVFIREMKEKGLDNPKVKDALHYGLEALLKGRINP